MTKTKVYRYNEQSSKQKLINVHIKEMISVLDKEPIKHNLYIKGIKLSSHALKRVKQCYNIENEATATRFIKDILKDATRIGEVVAYDGRVNVLYAYNKNAIFLSPNLKTVVTVNVYGDTIFNPLEVEVSQQNKQDLIDMHYKELTDRQVEIDEQMKVVLDIHRKVEESVEQYKSIMNVGRLKRKKVKVIESMISEFNKQVKSEGRKLFFMQSDKRQIAKSLVSLI